MNMKVKHILTNPYAENCYVISDDNGTGVIIDPGSDAENISLQLKQIGEKPVAILLTHGHFDHVGAVNYLKNEYNLQVYANIYEKGILSDASKIYVFGGEGEAVKVESTKVTVPAEYKFEFMEEEVELHIERFGILNGKAVIETNSAMDLVTKFVDQLVDDWLAS